MTKKDSIQYSVIFLVVGFIGLAGSHYGDVISDMYVKGFSLALSLVGYVLSLAFLIEALNKEYKKNENKKPS